MKGRPAEIREAGRFPLALHLTIIRALNIWLRPRPATRGGKLFVREEREERQGKGLRKVAVSALLQGARWPMSATPNKVSALNSRMIKTGRSCSLPIPSNPLSRVACGGRPQLPESTRILNKCINGNQMPCGSRILQGARACERLSARVSSPACSMAQPVRSGLSAARSSYLWNPYGPSWVEEGGGGLAANLSGRSLTPSRVTQLLHALLFRTEQYCTVFHRGGV